MLCQYCALHQTSGKTCFSDASQNWKTVGHNIVLAEKLDCQQCEFHLWPSFVYFRCVYVSLLLVWSKTSVFVKLDTLIASQWHTFSLISVLESWKKSRFAALNLHVSGPRGQLYWISANIHAKHSFVPQFFKQIVGKKASFSSQNSYLCLSFSQRWLGIM